MTDDSLEKLWAQSEPVAPPRHQSAESLWASGRPMPKVGPAETFFSQGADVVPLAKPLVDGIVGGTVAALGDNDSSVKFTPQALAEMKRRGVEPEAAPGLVEHYRRARDMRTERGRAGAVQNPGASALGTGLGLGASLLAAMPVAKVGSGVFGSLASAGLTGAGYGGVNALTRGPADLTKGEWRQALKDLAGVEQFGQAKENMSQGNYLRALLDVANAGAPGGLLSGLAVGGTVAAARQVPQVARGLNNVAESSGRRALLGPGADSMANRDALRSSSVLEAIDSGGIEAFASTPATYEKLQALANSTGASYQKVLNELHALGVKGPTAEKIALEMMERGQQLRPHTLNEALPQQYDKVADQVLNKHKLLGGVDDAPMDLLQLENLKRSAQEQARYGQLHETPLNNVNREIASRLKRNIEDSVDAAAEASMPGSRLRELAADFRPLKAKTGNLLEAEAAAQRGAARFSQRGSAYSPDPISLTAAVAGHPEALVVPAVRGFLKNRLPSGTAVIARTLARGLETGSAVPRSARLAEAFAGALLGRPGGLTPAIASGDSEEEKRRLLAELLRGDP